MLKSRKLLRLTVSLVLIVTVVLSTMSFTGTVAAAKPWYEDGMRQLTDRGVIASSEASPDAGVKASNFLRMAVLWFTYNHGEDYNTVASELGWIKDGENFADDSFVKRGEAVKICLRALGLDNEEHKSLKQYIGNLDDGVVKSMIRLAWASVADMAIIPLQDVLELDEDARMNMPGTIDKNWLWKFRPKDLTHAHAEWLRKLTETYGR